MERKSESESERKGIRNFGMVWGLRSTSTIVNCPKDYIELSLI
jgi:hypothetical protein